MRTSCLLVLIAMDRTPVMAIGMRTDWPSRPTPHQGHTYTIGVCASDTSELRHLTEKAEMCLVQLVAPVLLSDMTADGQLWLQSTAMNMTAGRPCPQFSAPSLTHSRGSLQP